MPEPLPREEVERIARLAHLALSEDETGRFARQLGQILAYANQVQRVDTTGVPPTSHPLAPVAVERADEVAPSLDRPDALSGAPASADGLFEVPGVLGQ
jgi:aspartyl-tRNA(Asn)/glutamyl-tRNA(Gln) amidotransferase subunit C